MKFLFSHPFHQTDSYSRVWIILPTVPRQSPRNSDQNNDGTSSVTMYKTRPQIEPIIIRKRCVLCTAKYGPLQPSYMDKKNCRAYVRMLCYKR